MTRAKVRIVPKGTATRKIRFVPKGTAKGRTGIFIKKKSTPRRRRGRLV